MGRALGMHVLFAAFKGSTGMGSLYTPFDEMLERAGVITLHCPLTTATHNMIGAPEFSKMKRKPLLINTARGGLVDEAALSVALRDGIIGGAGSVGCASSRATPGPHAGDRAGKAGGPIGYRTKGQPRVEVFIYINHDVILFSQRCNIFPARAGRISFSTKLQTPLT
jgi:hypothetical protein